jgi:hypothetical protein
MTMSQMTTQRPAVPAPATSVEFGWRVRVRPADVRQARDTWLAARDGGAPTERVQDLREELERLWRAEAYQTAYEVTGGAAR